MKLTVNLSVKFRIAGITLGTVNYSQAVDVPAEVAVFAALLGEKIKFDERGVKLSIAVA